MAGAQFVDAQTCPWAQGLHVSSQSSTPGTHGFQIRVVLLLDLLPTKAAKPVWPDGRGGLGNVHWPKVWDLPKIPQRR